MFIKENKNSERIKQQNPHLKIDAVKRGNEL